MTYLPKLAAAVLVAGLTGPASAAISLDFVPVDNSALLTGYNTFDLQMNSPDSDWTAAVMLLETTAGSIYQHTPGVDGIQFPAALPYFYPGEPAIVFDTYVIGNVLGGGGDLDGSTGYAFDTGRLDVSWYNNNHTNIGSFPISRITLSDDAVGTWSLLSITADKQRLTLVGTISQGVMAIDAEGSEAATLAAYLDSEEYRRTLPRREFVPKDIDLTTLFVTMPDSLVEVTEGETSGTLPEPGTVTLLGLGGLALLRRYR